MNEKNNALWLRVIDEIAYLEGKQMSEGGTSKINKLFLQKQDVHENMILNIYMVNVTIK